MSTVVDDRGILFFVSYALAKDWCLVSSLKLIKLNMHMTFDLY